MSNLASVHVGLVLPTRPPRIVGRGREDTYPRMDCHLWAFSFMGSEAGLEVAPVRWGFWNRERCVLGRITPRAPAQKADAAALWTLDVLRVRVLHAVSHDRRDAEGLGLESTAQRSDARTSERTAEESRPAGQLCRLGRRLMPFFDTRVPGSKNTEATLQLRDL